MNGQQRTRKRGNIPLRANRFIISLSLLIIVAGCGGGPYSNTPTPTPKPGVTPQPCPTVSSPTPSTPYPTTTPGPVLSPTPSLTSTPIKPTPSPIKPTPKPTAGPCQLAPGVQPVSPIEVDQGNASNARIALTFDAGGPVEPASKILATLAKYDLHVTSLSRASGRSNIPM